MYQEPADGAPRQSAARYPGGVPGGVTEGVNDDFGFGDFIEDEIGIRRGCQAPDGRVVRRGADVRVKPEKGDDELNARPDASRALRRVGRDVIED